MEALDSSIRNLLKVITQIQGQSVLGNMSVSYMSAGKPYWHLCVEKFHAAYIKAKNPDGFREMFLSFLTKNLDKFTEDVVDEDGDINDEWLKNKEVLSKSSKKKKTDEYSFSLKNINCRGEIIYFDESNEKIRNVSIPITEAYLAACKIYADGAKNGQYSPLPAQLLHALFWVMSQVCEEENRDDILKNLKALKDVIDSLTDGDDQDPGIGSTLDPISGMMKTLASKFGLGGEGGFDLGSIEKKVSGLFSDDVTGDIKSVFNKFTEKVKMDGSNDITSIISNVSDAMKDTDLQESLKSTLSNVAAKVGFGDIKFSEEEKQKINPTSGDAAEQE